MFYSWNIIGHEKELAQLEENVRSGNIHHAYLFVGPEKIGKFRIAKEMGRIVQCENNFCRTCPTCMQIEKRCHPDTIELMDDGESIKIHDVRDIIARLSMTSQSRYKVLLIENIGRLTEEAANCLLKTLEEPTIKTLFLFTASKLKDILPTISSRMRTIHFKKLPDDVLAEALAKQYPELSSETINQVIFLSLGRSGRALQLLAEPETFAQLRDMYERIRILHDRSSVASRFSLAAELAANPESLKTFMALLVQNLRAKMLSATSHQESLHHIQTIEKCTRATDLLARNVNQRLVLEHLLLAL